MLIEELSALTIATLEYDFHIVRIGIGIDPGKPERFLLGIHELTTLGSVNENRDLGSCLFPSPKVARNKKSRRNLRNS